MTTDRIRLRRWREEDAPRLFQMASDPDVGPKAGWPVHESEKESLQVIRKFLMNDDIWAIEVIGTRVVVGCIGYLPAGRSNLPLLNAEVEVGYWIGKDYWNKGFCTEALHLLIDYCFRRLHLITLWGGSFVDNPASGRVMEKCGFVDTGKETLCENLSVGKEKPVRIRRLDRV